MPDWTKSMEQTYLFYEVDPDAWTDEYTISNITSASITRDIGSETLWSANIECDDDLSDRYIRIYLQTLQDRINERFPLGTFLCQTPGNKFDGKTRSNSADGYSPLIELKEKKLPLGFYIPKGDNIMERATQLTREYLRAPVVPGSSRQTIVSDFVSQSSDTVLTFVADLIANDKRLFDLDDIGRVLFSPVPDIKSMYPVWTFTDDNSSILYPDISLERDLYGVPNVLEVLGSTLDNHAIYSKVVNDNPNSETSTVARGREIHYREDSPSDGGTYTTQEELDEYAERRLKSLSNLEYTLSYTHGFCPDVNIGKCVRLNYDRAGLVNVKARVTRQSISCTPGAAVQETVVFNKQLWKE